MVFYWTYPIQNYCPYTCVLDFVHIIGNACAETFIPIKSIIGFQMIYFSFLAQSGSSFQPLGGDSLILSGTEILG